MKRCCYRNQKQKEEEKEKYLKCDPEKVLLKKSKIERKKGNKIEAKKRKVLDLRSWKGAAREIKSRKKKKRKVLDMRSWKGAT